MVGSFKDVVSICESFPLTAFDVGARGGVKSDLYPIASGTDYVLFEPDPDEFNRLNQGPSSGDWKSLRCVNKALAAEDGRFTLNLYRQRGCSSKFRADTETAAAFSRGDYYILDGTASVEGYALDGLVERGEVPEPHFIKIDVQGMEVDVFRGGLRGYLIGRSLVSEQR